LIKNGSWWLLLVNAAQLARFNEVASHRDNNKKVAPIKRANLTFSACAIILYHIEKHKRALYAQIAKPFWFAIERATHSLFGRL
jgi:hypothetical protein